MTLQENTFLLLRRMKEKVRLRLVALSFWLRAFYIGENGEEGANLDKNVPGRKGFDSVPFRPGIGFVQ